MTPQDQSGAAGPQAMPRRKTGAAPTPTATGGTGGGNQNPPPPAPPAPPTPAPQPSASLTAPLAQVPQQGQDEAVRKAAETAAAEEAARKAAEAARQEQVRKDAEAEAARKAAEAAKQEQDRKDAEAARQEQVRKDLEAANDRIRQLTEESVRRAQAPKVHWKTRLIWSGVAIAILVTGGIIINRSRKAAAGIPGQPGKIAGTNEVVTPPAPAPKKTNAPVAKTNEAPSVAAPQKVAMPTPGVTSTNNATIVNYGTINNYYNCCDNPCQTNNTPPPPWYANAYETKVILDTDCVIPAEVTVMTITNVIKAGTNTMFKPPVKGWTVKYSFGDGWGSNQVDEAVRSARTQWMNAKDTNSLAVVKVLGIREYLFHPMGTNDVPIKFYLTRRKP